MVPSIHDPTVLLGDVVMNPPQERQHKYHGACGELLGGL